MPATGTSTYVPKATICLGAIGARTPIGLTPESTAAAVRAGISNLTEHPMFVDRDGEPLRLASDAILAPDMPVMERMTELAIAALFQLPKLRDLNSRPLRRLLIVCTSEPRPGLPADAAERLGRSMAERLRMEGLRILLLPQGHAAGLLGFGVAARALDQGDTDVAVVIGVDSYQDRATLRWMEESGQLKSDRNIDGFFPSEAAAACLFARVDQMRAQELEPVARLTAVSVAFEPITIRNTNPEEACIGDGLSAALLGLGPAVTEDGPLITDMYCDLNGQRYRSEELLYSILRAGQLMSPKLVHLHPADCWGDVGAASGPLFAALAMAANRKAYAKGSRTVLWASSEGGRRAAALLDFSEAERKVS